MKRLFRILPALFLPILFAGCTSSGPSKTESPRAPVAAPSNLFIGSARCAECHPQQAERWSHSWHARALASARPEAVVGRFNDQHYKGTSSEAWMKRDGSEFLMRTIDGTAMLRDFPVQWVIGAKRMQDAVTVVDDGAWQVLPVYFHVTGRGEWVDYNETKQGPVGPDHPFFWTNFRRTANHECLDCHSTGLKAEYDRAAKKWKTEFADAGVACESCHGPGGRHADSASAADIVHPGKVDREQSLAICAQCHGPRQPVFPVLDARHRFRPGDRYDDFYQALVIVDGRARSGDFFADGRPRTSSFEYQALSQSRCALIGKATCLSCHSAPHAEHGEDELRPAAESEGSCRGCHAAVIADAAKHTRHQSKEAQSCLACHMPKLVTGVLDNFPDHALDIPVPENTARHAVPNACGSCHKDKAALVLQKDLLRLWPDAAKRQQRRLRLADAIDEKTAAQSQQALMEVIADETEASILRGAAAILLAQRFPQAASAALSPLLRHSDPLLRARALEGLGYAGGGVGADAVASLSNDSSISVRQMAALVLSATGDARGEAALRQLATNPGTTALPQPHLILGRIALQRGNFNEAAQELEQSVDLIPYAPDALVSLGGAYLRKGRLDLAREQALQALHFSPGNQGAQRLLGMIGTH